MANRPTIYVVAMPIGTNWADLTDGAREVLATCPNLFLERAPKKVDQMIDRGLIPPDVPVHWMDGDEVHDVGACLDRGEDVALVAATGMPCFFDPGWAVMDDWLERRFDQVDVVPVGMSSALDAALAMSGIDFEAFRFGGHYPEKYRRTRSLLPDGTALVYYVRGESVTDFVREIRRSVRWIRRIVLWFDMRKGARKKVWVVRGNRGPIPDEIEDDPTADVVAVISRAHPVKAVVRAASRWVHGKDVPPQPDGTESPMGILKAILEARVRDVALPEPAEASPTWIDERRALHTAWRETFGNTDADGLIERLGDDEDERAWLIRAAFRGEADRLGYWRAFRSELFRTAMDTQAGWRADGLVERDGRGLRFTGDPLSAALWAMPTATLEWDLARAQGRLWEASALERALPGRIQDFEVRTGRARVYLDGVSIRLVPPLVAGDDPRLVIDRGLPSDAETRTRLRRALAQIRKVL